MKQFYLLLTLSFSLTICKADVSVTMYSSPIVLTAPSPSTSDSYDIDFENNGIPDVRIDVNYYVGSGTISSEAWTINDQNVEIDCVSDYRAVAYNCGASLGGGSGWQDSGNLGHSDYQTFYEGAGQKYIGFKKFSSTVGSNNFYRYGWIKVEVSADGRTLTIYGFGIGNVSVLNNNPPNVYAGQGNCDVSVQEYTLPADAVTVLGNTVQVKTEEPASIELFDLAGKLLFTDRKNGAMSIFQLPVTNSLVLLRVTAGIRSRTVKVKL